MTMTNEEVALWSEMIDSIARFTARDFPDSSVEDLLQSIWVVLLEKQKTGRLLDPEHQHAKSALRFVAKEAAWNERKQHLTRNVQYSYRTSDIRVLFDTFFCKEDWENAFVPADAESEFNVGVEMSSDLSLAWDKLTRPHKVLIFQYFGLRQQVDSKKLSRALSRVADILNNYQPGRRLPGPGQRRVLTNAAAAAIVQDAMER